MYQPLFVTHGKLPTSRVILAWLFPVALVVSACQGQPSVTPDEAVSSPTPVVVLEETCSGCTATVPPEPFQGTGPIGTATPLPMRFTFPTPGPEPLSDWRPPLYPVPWAPGPHDHFYFTRPIAADEVNWPLASYRYGGVFFKDVVHTGVDIPAKMGVPVIAAGSGTVTWADWGLFRQVPGDITDPYGRAVVVHHDFGHQGDQLYTVYAHLSRVDVVPGQRVETGQQIGLVGDSGLTTGPHLHFEVRVGKDNFFRTYNPELWLVPPQGWGLLVGRVMNDKGDLMGRYELQLASQSTKKIWEIFTYNGGPVRGDPYYEENMVLSDLPAGQYTLKILYETKFQYLDLTIYPGQVTYFSFRGEKGFRTDMPSEPGLGTFKP
jgi:murein DD-endopeptidase MepM/ murein hydrolase activator NlpD